jgi:glycerophosphoryl diester phosphodiesterase
MADNGFGAKDNSADFHLRVYTARPSFVTDSGGNGNVTVERFVELTDPKRRSAQVSLSETRMYSDGC